MSIIASFVMKAWIKDCVLHLSDYICVLSTYLIKSHILSSLQTRHNLLLLFLWSLIFFNWSAYLMFYHLFVFFLSFLFLSFIIGFIHCLFIFITYNLLVWLNSPSSPATTRLHIFQVNLANKEWYLIFAAVLLISSIKCTSGWLICLLLLLVMSLIELLKLELSH